MKTIKELLELVLKEYDTLSEYRSKNLCNVIDCMDNKSVFTREEYYLLVNYVSRNRPSKYSSLSAFYCRHSPYWYPRYEAKYRIKWLKKHIKKNS